MTAAMAKATAGRSARTAARHRQQVLAGIGFTTEHDLHRYVRRILVLDQLFGAHTTLTKRLGEDVLETRTLPRLLPLDEYPPACLVSSGASRPRERLRVHDLPGQLGRVAVAQPEDGLGDVGDAFGVFLRQVERARSGVATGFEGAAALTAMPSS